MNQRLQWASDHAANSSVQLKVWKMKHGFCSSTSSLLPPSTTIGLHRSTKHQDCMSEHKGRYFQIFLWCGLILHSMNGSMMCLHACTRSGSFLGFDFVYHFSHETLETKWDICSGHCRSTCKIDRACLLFSKAHRTNLAKLSNPCKHRHLAAFSQTRNIIGLLSCSRVCIGKRRKMGPHRKQEHSCEHQETRKHYCFLMFPKSSSAN